MKRAPTAADVLRKVKLNPASDCVAVFKPNRGCSFYIPDGFRATVKAEQDLPAHVKVMFAVTEMFVQAVEEKTPDAVEFVNRMYEAMLARGM